MRDLGTWIERTYHRRRRQARLGRFTPIEFEAIIKPASIRRPDYTPNLSPEGAAVPTFGLWTSASGDLAQSSRGVVRAPMGRSRAPVIMVVTTATNAWWSSGS
jgi:hypothetical protein